MSPVSGWRYHKRGFCPDCSDADASLYVPVIGGQEIVFDGKPTLFGPNIPHFTPVCKGCKENYSLDVLCKKHRYPLRTTDARCKVCPK